MLKDVESTVKYQYKVIFLLRFFLVCTSVTAAVLFIVSFHCLFFVFFFFFFFLVFVFLTERVEKVNSIYTVVM